MSVLKQPFDSLVLEPVEDFNPADSGFCDAFSCLFCDHVTNREIDITSHLEEIHRCMPVFSCVVCDFRVNVREIFMLHVTSHFTSLTHKNNESYINEPEENDIDENTSDIADCENSNVPISDYIDSSQRNRDNQYCVTDDETWVRLNKEHDYCENKKQQRSRSRSTSMRKKRSDITREFKTFEKFREALVDSPQLIEYAPLRLFRNEKHFSCFICELYVGTSFESFKKHFKIHFDLPGYACDECDMTFATKTAKQFHMKKVHPSSQKFVCELCSYITNTNDSLRQHIKRVHTNPPIPKKDKFKRFITFAELTQALQKNPKVIATVPPSLFSDVNEFPCCKCEYVANKFKYFINHFKMHAGVTPYVCKICTAAFTTRVRLKKHTMSVHATSRDFLCSQCPHTFKTKDSLRKHELHHHATEEQLKYQCPDCPEKFSLSAILVRHQKSIHKKYKPYTCSLCNHTTKNIGGLRRHLNKHIGLREHSCHICGSTHGTRCDLQRHMEGHNPEKTYHCSLCPYVSNRKTLLRSHYRIHSAERPYACTQCDFRTKNNGTLKEHINFKHSSKRPFACNNCTMTFKSKVHLKTHQETHDDIIYPCNLCSYHSKTQASYKRHMLLHDVRRRSNCDLCDKYFATPGELGHHKRRYHTEEHSHRASVAEESIHSERLFQNF